MAAQVSDVWDFKKDGDGCWRWQRQSLRHEMIEEGRTAFRKFEECVADAQRRGYTGVSGYDEPPRDVSGRLLRLTRR